MTNATAPSPAGGGLESSGARPDPSGDARRILSAAIAILEQGGELLQGLPPDAYGQRVPEAFDASIGGHYRHCLDHFTSLRRAVGSGEVDYDNRDRDPRIESQPGYALEVTEGLRGWLETLGPRILAMPVGARCEVSYARGSAPVTGSTLGREMVYAIAHAIHHYALISVMARLMEVRVPSRFGVAPSTVAHNEKQATR